MISTGRHKRGFVRAFGRRYPASGQHRLMEEHGVSVVYGDGSSLKIDAIEARDPYLRSLRKGDLACVAWLCLLADPSGDARKKRADLKAVIQQIENNGASIMELASGRCSDDRQQRDDMIEAAYGALTSGRIPRGDTSKLGRPPKWTDPEHRKIIWEEWHSNIHRSNTDAAAEAGRRLGRRISHYTMWKIVREMRMEKGLPPELGGKSGRVPGPAYMRVRANGKRVHQKVYFLRRADGAVKIGTSGSVEKRKAALEQAGPDRLTLLGTIPGDSIVEGGLHMRFAQYRIKGEWFRNEGTLAKYLAKLEAKK